MALVRVFGNTYLNPNCVGKVETSVTFTDTLRTTKTTVFDTTGQHQIAVFETKVSREEDNPDKLAFARDNHAHDEILRSLQGGRDAVGFSDLEPEAA